jgi:hypothetical protein
VIIITAIILFFDFYFSKGKTSVKAEDKATQVPSLSEVILATSTETVKNPINLSQTVGDVTVTVKYAKVIPTGIEIGICYTTLDGGEWYSMPDPIKVDSKEIKPDESGFTNETLATANTTGERCEFIRYKLAGSDTISTLIGFSIKALDAEPREMYSPCQEVQQRIDTSPKAQAAGVKMNCTENADGQAVAELSGFNPTFSREEAQQILDQIVGQMVNGPWVFTIDKLEK